MTSEEPARSGPAPGTEFASWHPAGRLAHTACRPLVRCCRAHIPHGMFESANTPATLVGLYLLSNTSILPGLKKTGEFRGLFSCFAAIRAATQTRRSRLWR